ncbi:hypothetical protein ACOMHN_005126 [Nucella lapillus]
MNAIDFYIFWSFFGAVIPPRFQAMWTLFLLHLVSFLWYQPAPCLQQLYPSFFSPALSHPLHYSSPPPPAPVPSVYPLRHYPPPLPSPPSSNLPMRYSRDQLLEIQPSTPNFELVNRLRELRLGVGLPRKRGCRGGRKKLRSIQVVPSRNLHPLMVPPFLQPHPDLQSAVGNAPLSSKHPTHLPTTDCLLSITPLMGGQPSDAPALSPPSPLQQGGQSSNAPALSPPSPLPQGSQPIALALSPSSPLPQDGQPSDAPGLSPSSSTLLLCPSDSTLSICHLNSQSAVKTERHSLSGLFEEDNITVFLPTSDAYFRFQYEAETSFHLDYDNPKHLRDLLLYSSVRGRYKMADLPQGTTGTLPSRLEARRPLYINHLRTNIGNLVTINGARFVKTDLVSDNGVIHVISRVIAPIAHNSTLSTYVEKPALKQFAFTSIYFARAVVPNLTLETDRTDRWFTSFSPNDSFITVMPDYGQTPLFDNWTLLRIVYKAHVVRGNAFFLPDGVTLNDEESLHGTLKFSRKNNDLYVSNGRVRARVVQPNIPVQNGVLHVIDNLLYYVYRDVIQMVTSLPNTRKMAELIRKLPVDMQTTLNSSNREFTVFVPTDEAFAKLPANVLSRLSSDPSYLTELQQVIMSHVISDVTYDVSTLSQMTKLQNMNGTDIRIRKYGNDLYLEWGELRAQVKEIDLGVTNGIVHLIDTVLFASNFTVWEAITHIPDLRGIQDVMQEFPDVVERLSAHSGGHVTVFLPGAKPVSRASQHLYDWLDTATERVHNASLGHISTDSFNAHQFSSPTFLSTLGDFSLLITRDPESKADIYVQGSHVTAKVTARNVWCTNGVIFIIDEILHLPTRTIAEEISRRPELKYMTTMFSGFRDEPYNFSDPSSHFTLFMPNNDAFSYLPWPSIDRLLRESDRTRMILRAHIVPGEQRFLSDIEDEQKLPAIQNVIYLLTKHGKRYAINNNLWAEVVTSDIPAVNGHVHIINRLLYIPYHTISQLLHSMQELRPFNDLMSKYAEYKIAVEAEDRNVTLFIPSSRYLRTVTSKQMQTIKADPAILKRLYQGHTLPQVRMDDVFLSQFPDQNSVSKSSFNVSFQISRSDRGVFVDGGYDRQILDVIGRAYGCTNGIIYVIDGFLNYSPLTILERLKREPTVSRSLQHMILLPPPAEAELLGSRNLTFTFLMPDDIAMEHLTMDDIDNLHKLPASHRQKIFWRHVLNGSEITYDDLRHDHFDTSLLPPGVTVPKVNGVVYFRYEDVRSFIRRGNLVAANGVIHLLSHYLYHPRRSSHTYPTSSPLHTPNPLPTPTSVKGTGGRGCRGERKKLRSIQVVPSRNFHPLMVPPFLQPHPDLQSAVGNAPLSSKHPTQLPTTDCVLSIIPLMGGQPSDATALSPPSPLQQGGQSSKPLLSRLHHHCRKAVNPLPWHSRLHHRRRRMVNPAMPLDSRPHHRHCCCVLVTLL